MTIIFDGSFTSGWKSSGGRISNFSFSCILAADRFTSLPIYRGRTKVGKFTIRPGDRCNVGTSLNERCQVARMWDGTKHWDFDLGKDVPDWDGPSVVGTTQWYGFSYMLDESYTSNGDWFQVWEFGWASESVGLDNRNMRLWIRQASLPVSEGSSPSGVIIPGVWYDFLIRVKLSYGTDGIFEVLLRRPGETKYTQVHYTNGVTARSDQLVHQTGPYRGKSTNTQIVYMSDYKVGTNRADVEYNPDPCPTSQCDFTIT